MHGFDEVPCHSGEPEYHEEVEKDEACTDYEVNHTDSHSIFI
jgi:hypothetical protein